MKAKFQYVIAMLALLTGVHLAVAQQTTSFTYQGELLDGSTNANGVYTMIFALCDAASGGNQIGGAITNNPTLANGHFSVNLDFGAGAFNGNARWLDVTVQTGSDRETLAPRVQVLPTPYAQFAAIAATVTNGAIGSAQLASNLTAIGVISGNLSKGTNLPVSALQTNGFPSAHAYVLTNNGSGFTLTNAPSAGASGTVTSVTADGIFATGTITTSGSFRPVLAPAFNGANITGISASANGLETVAAAQAIATNAAIYAASAASAAQAAAIAAAKSNSVFGTTSSNAIYYGPELFDTFGSATNQELTGYWDDGTNHYWSWNDPTNGCKFIVARPDDTVTAINVGQAKSNAVQRTGFNVACGMTYHDGLIYVVIADWTNGTTCASSNAVCVFQTNGYMQSLHLLGQEPRTAQDLVFLTNGTAALGFFNGTNQLQRNDDYWAAANLPVYNTTTWSTNGLSPIHISNPPGLPYTSVNLGLDNQTIYLFTSQNGGPPFPYAPIGQNLYALGPNGCCSLVANLWQSNGLVGGSTGSGLFMSNNPNMFYCVQNWAGNGLAAPNVNTNMICGWSISATNQPVNINQSGSCSIPEIVTGSIRGLGSPVVFPNYLQSSLLSLGYDYSIYASVGMVFDLGNENPGSFFWNWNGASIAALFTDGSGYLSRVGGVSQIVWDASGNLTATSFNGNGRGLTNVTASRLSGYNTNMLTAAASASFSGQFSTINSGWTNSQGANASYLYNGTSGTAVLYWHGGVNGASVCANPVITNAIGSQGGSLPVPPGCGVQIVSGSGVTATVVFP